MLLATLDVSMLANILTVKGVMRAGEGVGKSRNIGYNNVDETFLFHSIH